MNYKNLPNDEIAKIMIELIEKLNELSNYVLKSLNNDKSNDLKIHKEYRDVKMKLKQIHRYVQIPTNKNPKNELYETIFKIDASNAYVFGMKYPVDFKHIDDNLYFTINNAINSLTTSYSLIKWKEFIIKEDF